MSRNITTRKSTRLGLGLVGAGAAALLFLTPVMGANFSASDTGRVDVSTATLTLDLSGGSVATGGFDLDFTNLKPGEVQTKTFTVKNTGSIAANVAIGNPVSGVNFSGGNQAQIDPSDLKVGVVNYQNLVSAPSLASGSINLGSLNAGQSRTYTLQIGLDQSAGNEWQGVTLGATATVTLSQS